MFRINSINSVNNNILHSKTSFKGSENQTNPQIEQLNAIQPDFAVKTPMKYTKTGEIDFPYDTKAHCYKLANGQKVIIVPQMGETVLRTYVNTGSMNEPDNIRGISHYIEHNLFNGSKGIENGDFFKQVDKIGAYTNASTGFAETNYVISSNLLNEGDLENKIKLHASMLETPLFAFEKLEKEKDIVNSEINMITSKPQNIAVNKMLKNLYGIKSTSLDMIGGTTDNITNLTREDVVNYYNNNYYPANMVTVITGDVNPDETMTLISKYFTSTKQPPQNRYFEKLTPTNKTIREDIISDKAVSTTIAVGFNGPKSNDTKDRILTSALLVLLSSSPSSRISTKLKPLNSDIYVENEKISSNPNEGRAIIFTSNSSENNSEKVLKSIFQEIGNLKNNPPSEKEMQIVKKLMLRTFAENFEDSNVTNDIIGTSILENNKNYLNDFEKIVNGMTPQDLVNIAQKYFDINKASVTLVHPQKATSESITKNYNDAISFTGAKKDVINMDSVKEYNLSNNYRVININSKTDNVKISYSVRTDKYMPSRPSAALVLDEILRCGTIFKNKETFDSELAQNGIIRGISATECALDVFLDCDSKNIDSAFSGIRENIENPRFTADEFQNAKNLIIDRINTSEKSAWDKLDSEIFKGLPKGYSKQEILKDLETLSLDDVKALYTDIKNNGKGVVVVSAPFDKNPELRKTVFDSTAKFKSAQPFTTAEIQKVFTPIENTKVLTDTNNKNQAEIIQAYKFKVNPNTKDRAAIKLLNIILGGTSSSRLFMDLRENEKLAYHVKSNYSHTEDIGLFTLKIETTTDNKDTGEKHFDNIQKSIDGFNRHIEKIINEKVTDEELNNAKLNLKNSLLNSNHLSEDKVSTLNNSADSVYSIGFINKLFNEIDNITAEDIQNAANYIFSNKPTYSIVATEDTLKANSEYLAKLANS